MKAKRIPAEREGGLLSVFAMLGFVALPILCCAGPALVAGGALTGLGGAVSSPWLLLPALVLLSGGVALLMRRRVRQDDTSCCPPPAGSDLHDKSVYSDR